MTGTPGDGGAAVGGGVAPGDQLRGGQREVGGHPAPAAATASSLHRQSKVSRAATNHQRSFHIRGEGPYQDLYANQPYVQLSVFGCKSGKDLLRGCENFGEGSFAALKVTQYPPV